MADMPSWIQAALRHPSAVLLAAQLLGVVLYPFMDGPTGRAALSLFGLIHSVLPSGGVYLPWSGALLGSHLPYHWAAGYAVLAVLILLLGRGGAESTVRPSP